VARQVCAALGVGVPWLASGVRLPTTVRSEAPIPRCLAAGCPSRVLQLNHVEKMDRYEITQRAADIGYWPGLATTVWGYDGTFPGPTIQARRGRPVVVRHHNNAAGADVVHLHGGHTPRASDGYPTDHLLPAGFVDRRDMHDPRAQMSSVARDYRYPMDQRAATLWYHDHRMDFTGRAYGASSWLFPTRRRRGRRAAAPRGDRDIPLMITAVAAIEFRIARGAGRRKDVGAYGAGGSLASGAHGPRNR